jgi:alpha-tubulin suppressor-like RCC1 family protein
MNLRILAMLTVSILSACGGDGGSSRVTPMLAGGANQTCSLAANGTVQCWGINNLGQLGNGMMTGSTTPVPVSGISTAIHIAAGNDHSCAVLGSGAVQCWGNNISGQLGNGTNANSAVPVTVSGISQATWVAAGSFHSCAVIANGTVQCWGGNFESELGNGNNINSNIPVTVNGISSAKAVASDANHSCALLRDGSVQCWGYGFFGQLGNGSNAVNNATPVTVSGISNATAIAVGGIHTCALLSDQSVQCWGDNQSGQLGIGISSSVGTATPVAVNGVSSAIALSSSASYTCALISDGTLKCWGTIIGTIGKVLVFREFSNTPVSIAGVANVSAVSVALGGVCVLINDGTVQCWGMHPLGDGTINDSYTPVTVRGIDGQGTLILATNI